jgi:glycosyltransferase involved in cell wall biosynthesis
MGYQPNEDAVLFFIERVMPFLRRHAPGVRFVVAGGSPSARVSALHNGTDVLVTGYVADKAALFRSCTVFVCPIRVGGGTRIKILEAMAAGKSVVSTSAGAEGIEAVPGEHIAIADSPSDLAAACARALRDRAWRERLGRAGQMLVRRQYTWDSIRAAYVRMLRARLDMDNPLAYGMTRVESA